MSAKKPPRLAGLGRRKKLVVVCLAIVCALIAVGLYAWQSQPVPEAGASVTTAEGKSRQEIQDELDAIVRDNMMTISVAPSLSYRRTASCASTCKTSKTINFPSDSASSKTTRPCTNPVWSRPARQSRRAPPATSKKERHTSRSRHSMPRPSTATAIRHVSRYGLSKPRTSFFGRRDTARNSPAFVQSSRGRPAANRKERPWTSPGT